MLTLTSTRTLLTLTRTNIWSLCLSIQQTQTGDASAESRWLEVTRTIIISAAAYWELGEQGAYESSCWGYCFLWLCWTTSTFTVMCALTDLFRAMPQLFSFSQVGAYMSISSAGGGDVCMFVLVVYSTILSTLYTWPTYSTHHPEILFVQKSYSCLDFPRLVCTVF